MKRVPQPIKWHGGKFYLAKWIVSKMPKHIHYVETHFGGGAVLLAKDPEGISEVANDIYGDLINFWRVLQNNLDFKEFQRRLSAIPFSEAEWKIAKESLEGPGGSIARAVDFFICCRQSLAGRMKSFAPLSKTRTRGGMNEQASAWLSAVDGLPIVHKRMRRVAILNRDAIDIFESEDSKKTLFYVDAPYVCSSRTAPDVYCHEMTDIQHLQLIEKLLGVKGKVIVSMYHHKIYNALSEKHGWRLAEKCIDNKSGSGKKKQKRVECLWMNY